MPVPGRPAAPVAGKATHYNLELSWDQALDELNANAGTKGDSRVKVCVQVQEKHGGWANVYTGYAKAHVMDDLESWTTYTYRIRFINASGNSEWSPPVSVTTLKEPLTGEHLHKAILLEDLKKFEAVLESGDVQVDTPDKYGFSPLMAAAQKGYIDFIECLVRHGATVNYQNDAGKSSLMVAAYAGKTQAVKELRHHGAQWELKDKGGSTALHWSMDNGNTELIEWMVDNGADLSVTDLNGWTPLLRVAAVGGNMDVGRLLLRLGADINIKDKDGKTALMIAVVNGHHGLVSLLLDKGADLSVTNDYGKTAYDMALAMERRRVVKTLDEFIAKTGIKSM